MSDLSQANEELLTELAKEYAELSWFKRLFFPRRLAVALAEFDADKNMATAWPVCDAFLNHTWSFQRWIFSCLQWFSNSPLIQALNLLDSTNLLTGPLAQSTQELILRQKKPNIMISLLQRFQKELLTEDETQEDFIIMLDSLSPTIEKLEQIGLLEGDKGQANLEALIIKYRDYFLIIEALWRLYADDINLLVGERGQATLDVVLTHQSPVELSRALENLHRAGLLIGEKGQANWDVVVHHAAPKNMAEALAYINMHADYLLVGDRAQINWDLITKHKDPYSMTMALQRAHHTNFLNGEEGQANLEALRKHERPGSLANALMLLQKEGLLVGNGAEANRAALMHRPIPYHVALVLCELHKMGLLIGEKSQANREAIIPHPNLEHLQMVLDFLQEDYRRTNREMDPHIMQTHFDNLITCSNILFGAEINPIWHWITPHTPLFTEARFIRIIEIATEHRTRVRQGRDAMQAYIERELLGMEAPHQRGLNAAQSTHTASAHQSISESAIKLKNSYEEQLTKKGLDEVIQELSTWAKERLGSATSLKEKAALRGLHRITEIDYTFIDPTSNVSIRELLGFFWLTIHDEGTREGEIEEAQKRLIDGLYEIQRGYNLNAKAVDDEESDRPICVPGTFNKLMEKLAHVHPDVELRIITKEQAAAKFPLLVKEKAKEYLQELSREGSLSSELLDRIKEDGIGAIWDSIVEIITEEFLSEFGSLYTRDSEGFKASVESAKELSLEKEVLDGFRGPKAVIEATTHSPRFFQDATVEETNQGMAASITPGLN